MTVSDRMFPRFLGFGSTSSLFGSGSGGGAPAGGSGTGGGLFGNTSSGFGGSGGGMCARQFLHELAILSKYSVSRDMNSDWHVLHISDIPAILGFILSGTFFHD